MFIVFVKKIILKSFKILIIFFLKSRFEYTNLNGKKEDKSLEESSSSFRETVPFQPNTFLRIPCLATVGIKLIIILNNRVTTHLVQRSSESWGWISMVFIRVSDWEDCQEEQKQQQYICSYQYNYNKIDISRIRIIE